jgi:hypothetical protein
MANERTQKKRIRRSAKGSSSPQGRMPKSDRRRSSTKFNRKTFRAPRTASELFAKTKRFQELWNLAVQIPSEMRSRGLTLSRASRQLGVSTKTALQLVGSAVRRKRNGRYEVKLTDRLLRVLLIPSKKGLREIVVKDSREASLVGEYWSAVEKFLVRGDASALRSLRRKYVNDARGRRVRLLFNLEELKRQGSAGAVQFESIYSRTI